MDKQLSELLAKMGLDGQEQDVYVALLSYDWVTALRLSDTISIKRSTLYRVLARLKEKGLVEEIVDDATTRYRAGDVSSFDHLIKTEEANLMRKREILSELSGQITQLSTVKPQETQVRIFRGVEGLRRMHWRYTARPGSMMRIFDSNQWFTVLGQTFSEKIRAELERNRIMIHELNNRDERIPQDGSVDWTKETDYVKHCYRHRKIEAKIIPITQDFLVLGDMLQFQGWRQDEVIGIEITSHEYAAMFSAMFDVLWQQGKVLDGFGG